MRTRPKARLAAIAVAATIGFSVAARADLSDTMEDMFESMVNTTAPAAFDAARASTITGGGLRQRNRILSADLFGITPPRFGAGCGGIDLFAGSFSFINSDRLVQLGRSVAANAAGYAFQLALLNVCESCAATIETFMKKVQQLNQHFGNSCQLAQGILNDTVQAMGGKTATDASITNMVEGFTTDVFSAMENGVNSTKQLVDNDPDIAGEQVTRNLVWHGLINRNVADWLEDGDTELLQAAMTLSGTIIRTPREDPEENEEPYIVGTITPDPFLIEQIAFGGEARILSCDTTEANGCLDPTYENVTLTGFKDRILELLTGPGVDGEANMIEKIRSGGELTFTSDERQLFNALNRGAGSMLIMLSTLSDGAGQTFAEQAAGALAIDLARRLSQDLFMAVRRAVDQLDDSHSAKLHDNLMSAQGSINDTLMRLQEETPNLADLFHDYNNILKAISPNDYGPTVADGR